MRTFRGREVIGWRILMGYKAEIEEEINAMMQKFNFEDFQFTATEGILYAAILISKKEE